MINAVKNISSDVKTNLGGFKTQLDADGKKNQQSIIEFSKKIQKEKITADDKKLQVDYSKFESEVKSFLKENNLAIEFAIDEDTKKMVMKLIDEKTKEVVKQFPSDISLHIARILSNALEIGNITNTRV